MAVVCILLAAAAVVGTGMAACYRRQIKSIAGQLSFLNHHETNMRITGDYGTGCAAALIEELNTMLDHAAALQKESADSEARMKDTIINLSHDIRTPLTSLDGYFQLLLRSGQPDEQQRYAAIISDRLQSLKELLDELFTYARLTGKSYEMELTACRIKEILLNVLFSFYEDFKRSGIEPEIDLLESDVVLMANEAALRRVFQNILKNGLVHGKEKISVRSALNGHNMEFCFQNDCAASSPIDAERVFDRFYKADDARSRASTGLGLSIAKELVLRMKGSISASVQDNIFTIKISFPAL